jgi:phosphonate degradation associated HDIG domain protein
MKNYEIVEYIVELFNTKGGDLYGGESVTQLEHAIQCAHFATLENASDELITASLLHDIGHLLHDLPDNATENGIDDLHEQLGADFLNKYFKPEVTEAVKLHVEAKRYLCLIEPGYYDTLSPTSKASLILQGGIMNENEKILFETNTYFKEAVQLRKWDDLAKIPNFQVPPVENYNNAILNALN